MPKVPKVGREEKQEQVTSKSNGVMESWSNGVM
jgi:hypothetical protein